MSNGLEMTLHGQAGSVYHIQETTNISMPSWIEVGVVTNVSETIEVTVLTSGRFSVRILQSVC